MEDYLVPRGVGRAEYIEKKSRFLGGVYPVTSEQEAKEILERVRKQHYDARHNCWCYILQSGAEALQRRRQSPRVRPGSRC
ncbi:MAG: YigZ family protein [Oscillospiraceae bacterium]